MTRKLIAVVTGSNRGIGLGVIQLLAKTRLSQPLMIFATSRSGINLNVDAHHGNEIQYAKLDISDKTSIMNFISTYINTGPHVQAIDMLINNAGVNNNNQETPDLARQTIDINYRGTKDMCQIFLEQGNMATNTGSRIVNVSSTACQLDSYSPALQKKFRSVQALSDVDSLAESYVSAMLEADDSQRGKGWGSGARSYQVSKALINALTVVLAKQYKNVMINCCCPGWVASDMGHQIGKPPKTLEEGARIPVRLALGDLNPSGDKDGNLGQATAHISGQYFGNDSVNDHGWGKLQPW